MHTLKLRKIGNSVGFILPKDMQDSLRIQEGDTLYATNTPDGIQITPYDPQFEAEMNAFERTRRKYRNALKELAK